MDITLIKNTATEGLIKVTLKETDYQPKVEEKVKDYSKKANIKGFRQGKVPTGLIKKLYGKSILVEEINAILSKSITDYIKENDIKLIGEPLPNHDKSADIDWEVQKEFEFEYEVGLIDAFEINLQQKIKAYSIEPDTKSINKTIEDIKKQYGKQTEPEVSQEGDEFSGELRHAESDFTENVWIPSSLIKPKEVKQFVGLKKDQSIKIDLKKVIKDSESISKILKKPEEEAKKLKGEFEFKIVRISRVEEAELNQELFDMVFGKEIVKSEKEFMDKLKETLRENYNAEADNYTMKIIQDKLLETTTMNIPDKFYKKWILTTNKSDITPEYLDENFEKYIEELKWTLIVNKVADENEIKVEHTDVMDSAKDMIKKQFAAYGMTQNMDDSLDGFADNYLKGNDGQNYYNTYNKVRGDKIMAFIKEKMDITSKKVSPEEFAKIVEN